MSVGHDDQLRENYKLRDDLPDTDPAGRAAMAENLCPRDSSSFKPPAGITMTVGGESVKLTDVFIFGSSGGKTMVYLNTPVLSRKDIRLMGDKKDLIALFTRILRHDWS